MRPSPTNSATKYKIGTKKKGNDGNLYIVSITKTKVKRWTKYDDTSDKLKKKIYKWWKKLSDGQIIIVYEKTYKFDKNSKKWKDYSNNKDIKAIIWSPISSDSLDSFTNYIVKKNSKKELKKILKLKNNLNYFIENYKKYFVKYKIYSNKDYTLK